MWKKTGPVGLREQYEKAGLNIASVYGQGGAGGGMATVTPSQLDTAKADRPDSTQAMALSLQLGMQKAQIDNLNADTKLKEADASKAGAETNTIEKTRDILIANMIQSGTKDWFENIKSRMMKDGWKNEDDAKETGSRRDHAGRLQRRDRAQRESGWGVDYG